MIRNIYLSRVSRLEFGLEFGPEVALSSNEVVVKTKKSKETPAIKVPLIAGIKGRGSWQFEMCDRPNGNDLWGISGNFEDLSLVSC
jgi:hypothetical protein